MGLLANTRYISLPTAIDNTLHEPLLVNVSCSTDASRITDDAFCSSSNFVCISAIWAVKNKKNTEDINTHFCYFEFGRNKKW